MGAVESLSYNKKSTQDHRESEIGVKPFKAPSFFLYSLCDKMEISQSKKYEEFSLNSSTLPGIPPVLRYLFKKMNDTLACLSLISLTLEIHGLHR